VIEQRVIPPPAQQTVEVPAEMILQIATGMEDELEVAGRFGFDAVRYAALKTWPPFVSQVEAKRKELQASGVTFRLQTAYMAEDLAKDVYRIAKSNEATFLQKLETMRTFAKLADLEPKANTVATTGPAFSISINLTPPPPKEKVIDGTAQVDVPGIPSTRLST